MVTGRRHVRPSVQKRTECWPLERSEHGEIADGGPNALASLVRTLSRTRLMATGTVKWFNAQKGFGFIQPDNGGKDVFVHISAVERAGLRDLQEGQKITYEVEADRRSGKESAVDLKAA